MKFGVGFRDGSLFLRTVFDKIVSRTLSQHGGPLSLFLKQVTVSGGVYSRVCSSIYKYCCGKSFRLPDLNMVNPQICDRNYSEFRVEFREGPFPIRVSSRKVGWCPGGNGGPVSLSPSRVRISSRVQR